MAGRTKHPFTIEHILLGLVRHQPMHGYEIYQRLKGHGVLGMIWKVKQSQVYALLAKLEQAGYLDSATPQSQGAYPPRKELSLTNEGADAFAAWVSTPSSYWEDAQNEFLAKLFFAQLTADDSAYALVEQQQATCVTWCNEVRTRLQALTPCQSSEWLVLQLRIQQIEAFIGWLSGCLVHLTSPLMVQHSIAALNDSKAPDAAHMFVAYVRSPDGQAILEQYGFLPVSDPSCVRVLCTEELLQYTTHSQNACPLKVYAAATLKDAFQAIAEAFSTMCNGIPVHLTFAGSRYLAEQICSGIEVDVFASASRPPMHMVIDAGRIVGGNEHVFANNRLIVITPRQQPVHLSSLRDLAQPGLKIALGSGSTAIGSYTLSLLEQAEQAGRLREGERDAILNNVVFYEQDVRAVLAKVVDGDANVAIVYTSDYYGCDKIVDGACVYPVDVLFQA